MTELLTGYLYLVVYIALLLPGILYLRMKIKIANEVYRKMLHFVLLGIIPLWLYVYTHWWIAALACVFIVLLLYPVLALAERISWCASVLIERKKGEFKSSLVLVFLMFAIVITVCWGMFKDKWLALISVYAWGPGDAAAALVGKRFGRHKIHFKSIGGKKSIEGSAAMFCVSFLCVFGLLLLRGGMQGWTCMLISLVASFVSTVIELFSRDGNDTITCPLGAMAALTLLLQMLGGL